MMLSHSQNMWLIIKFSAEYQSSRLRFSVVPRLRIMQPVAKHPGSDWGGMIDCCRNEIGRQGSFAPLAEELLCSIGRVAFVHDEGLMDAVTAASGSGPAYVVHFMEVLAEAGARAGLSGAQ
ncbi:pyrroline-5-carboxylate reductase protein [Rhizobium grahamii CCGE 502]|uniref:Pyrroline-5-carboxylate reductase protein n=1 Tax=Rhizobium grahamii CCGE 502 TaxID=990285 RepID=S3HCT5_9HYPH|nr:pyrroline-5-carboxylate reductase protein [Rhizobium grahamii CCGE 502]